MSIATEALMEGLENRLTQMERKQEETVAELRSVEHELERRISDEQSDRERADESIRSDLSSLQHKVDYS